jgi:hypothetical protein
MTALTSQERAQAGDAAPPGLAMSTRIVAEAARLLGAPGLIPIVSSHVDGCLYHGDSGTLFAEALAQGGAKVAVPTTLNVGALDLLRARTVRLEEPRRGMARRLMRAYEAMGCAPTWTCAPYQAGHRPAVGAQVAWGESNAVVFCNSVLGARTNRYGDFLDIACAISGRAPDCGLHRAENRVATILVDLSHLSPALRASDVFYPALGSWLGKTVGADIAAIDGLQGCADEDKLKALGAASASSGAVALFHVVGVTPEAPTREAAFASAPPRATLRPSAADLARARDGLSTAAGERLDAIAIGSPHLSLAECEALERALAGRTTQVPFYACTGRHVIRDLTASGAKARLEGRGVTFVADTCVVVTPILRGASGTLMTNSGKFAHYAPGSTGHDTIFGSLRDCVESAVAGRVIRDEELWR